MLKSAAIVAFSYIKMTSATGYLLLTHLRDNSVTDIPLYL